MMLSIREERGVPDEAFMLYVFDRDAMRHVQGVARYSDEFDAVMQASKQKRNPKHPVSRINPYWQRFLSQIPETKMEFYATTGLMMP
jgi:hypothetical protein